MCLSSLPGRQPLPHKPLDFGLEPWAKIPPLLCFVETGSQNAAQAVLRLNKHPASASQMLKLQVVSLNLALFSKLPSLWYYIISNRTQAKTPPGRTAMDEEQTLGLPFTSTYPIEQGCDTVQMRRDSHT